MCFYFFDIPEELKPLFSFKAGQYINLIKEVNGEELHRSYSLCVSPSEGEWRVAVKKWKVVDSALMPMNHLKAGDLIEIMPPNGRFTTNISPEQKKGYLFITAGSGITRLFPLIKNILTVETESQVSLIYGNSSTYQIIFRDLLLDLKNQYHDRMQMHFILSREMDEDRFYDATPAKSFCENLQEKCFFQETWWRLYICIRKVWPLDCLTTLQSLGILHKRRSTLNYSVIELPARINQRLTAKPGESAHITIRNGRAHDRIWAPTEARAYLKQHWMKNLTRHLPAKVETWNGEICV